MKYNSQNRITNSVLRMIGEETMDNVEKYTDTVIDRSYKTFNSIEDVKSFFDGYLDNVYSNSNLDDIENIRYYTGTSFKDINAVLRDNWNYEVNGLLTDDKKNEFLNISRNLSNSMNKVSNELPSDIKVYRGVTLASFKDYGINSISDLKSMVGQYFYERGFTSTSLLRESSAFNSNSNYWKDRNIEIEYLIPSEFSDGLPLITKDLCYTGVEHEFLINTGSLCKIVDVMVDEDKAYLTAVFIPKKVYDKTYSDQQSNVL